MLANFKLVGFANRKHLAVAKRAVCFATMTKILGSLHSRIAFATNGSPIRCVITSMVNDGHDGLSPLRGLGIFRERDPRVTLAALAHPGLLSVAAFAAG